MNTPQDPELKGAVKLVKYWRDMPDEVRIIADYLLDYQCEPWMVADAVYIHHLDPDTFQKYPFLAILANAASTDPKALESVANLALTELIECALREVEL